MSQNGSLELVPIPMVYSTMLLSTIGLVGNVLIVLATLITKNLHNRCQTLIAILAAADGIVCIYLIQLRVLMFDQWYMVPNRECFSLSLPGLFSLNVQAAMGLILGCDRLIAVMKPLKYNQISKGVYAAMMAIGILYAVIVTGFGYMNVSDEIVPVCLPPTAYTLKARKLWVASSFGIAIVVLFLYGAAHIKCKRLSAESSHPDSVERIRRLLNSLSLVVAIYFFTWFLTIVALVGTVVLPLSARTIAAINQQLAWLVIINSSTNFFIYAYRSSDYRRAFLYFLTFGFAEHPNKERPTRTVTITLVSSRPGNTKTSSVT